MQYTFKTVNVNLPRQVDLGDIVTVEFELFKTEYNFGRVIGTTSRGAQASNLRVVIGSNGNVITAFPF